MAHSFTKSVFRQIDGKVDVNSSNFKENLQRNEKLVKKFCNVLKLATSGGGEKAIERHTIKNRKLLVTDRLKLLFDDFDDVLEVMPLAGMAMKYGDVPRAGILSAIGKINGVQCIVIANDATVKAGTVFPITLKKQLRSIEIAQESNIPCVFVVDSGGAFLPLQAEIFLPGGRTFYNEAILSSLDIPQLAIVCGSCTAGAAYVPAMAQEASIVEKIGTIFLAGPPLVQAALGEVVTPDELGGAKLHSRVSGVTDYYAETEQEAFEFGRSSVAAFNIEPVSARGTFREPIYDADELLGIIPTSQDQVMNMHKIISRLVDGSEMHEFKASYATTIVTGFCQINGYLVGIVGNNGALTSAAALKASHFIQLCEQRHLPIIFLQNITQDDSSSSVVSSTQKAIVDGEKLRCHAKLMSTVACARVPKVTVVVGNSFGVENYMMCGRSFSPRFLFIWPTASASSYAPPPPPPPSSIIFSLSQDNSNGENDDEGKRLSSALYSSFCGWDDGIVLPSDTRKVLGKCLDIIHQTPNWTTTIEHQSTTKRVLRM